MSSEIDQLTWSAVADAAANMFDVWVDRFELDWAEQTWTALGTAGLLRNDNLVERLVTLARIYREFCALAWDEHASVSLNELSEDLDIDPIALGILAGFADRTEFEDIFDEYDLREAALGVVTQRQKAEIFKSLELHCGSDIKIYQQLWRTRFSVDEAEGEEFEPTAHHGAALNYVMQKFQEG